MPLARQMLVSFQTLETLAASQPAQECHGHSTVTLLAKLRGLSTSVPMAQAV